MGSKDLRKRNKRGKVDPISDDFEMDEASDSVTKKISPFLNNIRESQKKNNNVQSKALEAIIGAKKTASRWRDFITRKRTKKKSSVEGANVDDPDTDRLGLDDVHQDYLKDQIFGNKGMTKTMSAASNRALIQYFAQLGHSKIDNEMVDLNLVETLVDSGADINCTDKHGQSLLHEVASKWHTDVAKFLLELGANVNKTDAYGRTPLHVAAADDYAEMVDLLIEHEADREAKTFGENQTPVHYAAKNDAVQALKALIKQNCEFRMVRDSKGRTPLHVAAELDRSETARLLLELEAPAGVSEDSGLSIMTWMITKMPPVAYDALEQFHTIDRPNRKQHFYLNLLVQDRKKDKNAEVLTPLQVAVRYKQFDILTHDVFIQLITLMWQKFARWRAIGSLVFNFVYILLWTAYGVSVEYDKRHKYVLPEQWWRIVILISAVAITIWMIIDEIREYHRSKSSHEQWKTRRESMIDKDMAYCHRRWPEEAAFLMQEKENVSQSNIRYFKDPWNIFDWSCYFLLLTVIGTHVADIIAHTDDIARAHIRLTAITVIFLWLRLMKNVRAFAMLGPFVVMLGHMIEDVIKFAFLFLEFYIPYVCAFWMIFGGNKFEEGQADKVNATEVSIDGFTTVGSTLFSLWRLTMVDEYQYNDMKAVDSLMTDLLVGTYFALSTILCLNLFIALLSDTFQRVYDNAQANAVMQKAIMILSFWDGMSDESRNNFLDFIEKDGAPFKKYYDDDMTEGGDGDLKKVTIQIKEDLDELREKWKDQFGDEEQLSALEELRGDVDGASPLGVTTGNIEGKMVTTQRFHSEIDGLRDELKSGMVELIHQQSQMMEKFKRDINMVKALLLDIGGQGRGQGHGGGHGGSAGDGGAGSMQLVDIRTMRSGFGRVGNDMGVQMDTDNPNIYQGSTGQSTGESSRPKSAGKKKKKKKAYHEEDSLMEAPQTGMFAPMPSGQHPMLEIQDFTPVHQEVPEDQFHTDVRPVSHSSIFGHDHSTA